jgi:gamma-tubulin complex component 2
MTGAIASVYRNRRHQDSRFQGLPQASTVSNDGVSFKTETYFTRAPLNSCVSSTSGIQNGEGKTTEENLDRVPVDIQEALVLEDLMFILVVCTCYVGL